MSTMKIGIFSDGYLPSINGVTTSVETSASALEALGHQVTIVAPKTPHYTDQDHNVIWVRSVLIPGQNTFRAATYLPGTSVLMALRLDVDIIHAHAGGPISWLGWEVARIKRIPFVFTYHTLFNQYTHYFLKGKVIKPRMAEVATRVFGNMTDYVIAPTQKVRDELLNYGVKKPIIILPSGIDLQQFSPQPVGDLRHRLGISRQAVIFLFAGRLGKEKSVDLLIRAFGRTARLCPQAHLVIAGDGPDRHKLEMLAQVTAPDRIHFLGFVPRQELPQVYSDADVFAFASNTETQGLVVTEAMACGLPVVAIDDPVYKGVVVHDQEGLLVKHHQLSFSKAMTSMAESPEARRRMSRAALACAQKFSLEIITHKLAVLYQDLIDNPPPSSLDLKNIPPWLRLDRRDKSFEV